MNNGRSREEVSLKVLKPIFYRSSKLLCCLHLLRHQGYFGSARTLPHYVKLALDLAYALRVTGTKIQFDIVRVFHQQIAAPSGLEVVQRQFVTLSLQVDARVDDRVVHLHRLEHLHDGAHWKTAAPPGQ